jgi:hypothetical protein
MLIRFVLASSRFERSSSPLLRVSAPPTLSNLLIF